MLRSYSFRFFSPELSTLVLRNYKKSEDAVGVVKTTVGVVDRCVLQKAPFLGLSKKPGHA